MLRIMGIVSILSMTLFCYGENYRFCNLTAEPIEVEAEFTILPLLQKVYSLAGWSQEEACKKSIQRFKVMPRTHHDLESCARLHRKGVYVNGKRLNFVWSLKNFFTGGTTMYITGRKQGDVMNFEARHKNGIYDCSEQAMID